MATLPSSPPSKIDSEAKHVSSSEVSKNSESHDLKSQQVHHIPSVQKFPLEKERQVKVNSQGPLPGTYYLKANEARGKHMVQYVYANLTDPNDESLPFHIRERFKEIQKERLRGYNQQAISPRGTSPISQHVSTNTRFIGNKMPRPASASYERKAHNVSNNSENRPGKYVTDVVKAINPAKTVPKAVTRSIQQTRSSNTVLSPKRGPRSRKKTSSPRPRRRFSIPAESTSDTDPIENQRSMESIPNRSPPRTSGSRQVRRQQYLATKFKLAARNSKHTQTFVAAVASMGESSESATTVISRHHSTTQTEIVNKNTPTPRKPDCEVEKSHEEKDTSVETRNADAEKPPIAPQNAVKSEATLSTQSEKGQESLEWKRAKVRLRSTPRSPSPPLQESQHRVASADRVRVFSKEKPSCLAGGRVASGHGGLAFRVRSPTPPAPERQFTTSATQIEHQTKDTGVQVKLKKTRSSQRQARKERTFTFSEKCSLHDVLAKWKQSEGRPR